MKNIVCIKELFESKGKALQPANHPRILRIILLGFLYNLHAELQNDSGELYNPMGRSHSVWVALPDTADIRFFLWN